MSSNGSVVYTWDGASLQPGAFHNPVRAERPASGDILAADSWLVTDGSALALDLHRARFLDSARQQLADDLGGCDRLSIENFWQTSLAAVPREGNQFPRVELCREGDDTRLYFHQRPAPQLAVSLTVATHHGDDPRTQPLIKGPDTASLWQARAAAQQLGADEAVILSPDGHVVEGTTTSILWWHGDTLCSPAIELDRVDSVTSRSVIALATALGTTVAYDAVRPADLDGHEVWALSALHGIRIITGWVDGPNLAEEPGRLGLWRARMSRLRKPLPSPASQNSAR